MLSVEQFISRRKLMVGSASLLGMSLAACVSTDRSAQQSSFALDYSAAYGPMPEEPYAVPAVNLDKVDKKFWRQQVDYTTPYPAGSIIVDTDSYYLYHVEDGGTAMRYGVGLGRSGFSWSGEGQIARKKAWPKWTPPTEMIKRQPELDAWSAANGGMPPGAENPLGARALYIFQANVDTLYRIHGTPEYWSIGRAVSSGCVRMINQDIIDLYARVQKGSRLIVT